VITTLTAPIHAGDSVIEVADQTGFSIGDVIQIDSESNEIMGFSSIVLNHPMAQDHPLGATVKLIAKVQVKNIGTCLFDMVKQLPNAPADPLDYTEAYLNADGYQGVLPRDLEYCWNPASLTTPPPFTVQPTVPPPTQPPTTTTIPVRHCIAHLTKAAYKGDIRIEVDDAWKARFQGSQGGNPGSTITLGGVEEHRIFAVEDAHTVQLSRAVEAAFPVGTKVHSQDCSVTTPTTSVASVTAGPTTSTFIRGFPTATGCQWQLAPQCAATFSYKGAMITGCTLKDTRTPGAWCSDNAIYSGSWFKCEWHCPNPQTCSWKKDAGCVDQFTYQGHSLGPCTKFRYHTVWCSHTPAFTAGSNWRYCTWDCGCFYQPDYQCVSVHNWTYKGVQRNGCIVDHQGGQPWCSHDKEYNGHWSLCAEKCPEPKDDYGRVPKPTAISATDCAWKPVPQCKFPFSFQGQSYNACIKTGHKGAWCSTDSIFSNHWAHCKWDCSVPTGLQCKYEIGPGCVPNFSYAGQVYAGCHVADEQHPKGPWCSEVPAVTDPYTSGYLGARSRLLPNLVYDR
jgi:hypothetical protein